MSASGIWGFRKEDRKRNRQSITIAEFFGPSEKLKMIRLTYFVDTFDNVMPVSIQAVHRSP